MNKGLQIFSHEQFGSIRAFELNGEVWFVGKDLAERLEYKNKNRAIIAHVDSEDKLMVDRNNPIINYKELGQRGGWLINSNGALALIQNSKTKALEYKYQMKDWLMSHGLFSDTLIFKTRKEIEFVDMLENALAPFGITGIRQYYVCNKYHIDYYIPSLNIAIEYDEDGHRNYSYDEHEGRQLEIEEELNCKFIRVNDNNSNSYNIGLVIKEMFNINLLK